MSQKLYPLKPTNIIPLTEDAVEIRFELDTDHQEAFEFMSGQYISVETDIKGEKVRRAYSLCSAPHEEHLSIGVKKVEGGKMSSFLVNDLTVDTTLHVLAPEGRFKVKTNDEKARDHYFFAAGSGITPIFSMIKSILEHEPKSTCYLLYGNKTKESTMFYDELTQLSSTYKDQLYITHCFSRSSSGILNRLFGSNEEAPLQGRIAKETVEKFREKYPNRNESQQYYICGPGDMITQTQKVLEASFINSKDIKTEFFSAPTEDTSKTTAISNGESSQIKVILDDGEIEITLSKDEIVLDKLLDLGHDAPYSCKSGSCSSCIAKVTSGSVTMETCLALDDDEVEEGYILACQAKVVSDTATIVFED